jgi:hypothetical protein
MSSVAKPSPGATRPYQPKLPAMTHGPTLEQYEVLMRHQLDRLRRANRERQQTFDNLAAETRQAQMQKSRSLTDSNPLKYDESDCYVRSIAKIQRRYFARRKSACK